MNLIHEISNRKGLVTITCLFASGLGTIPLDVFKIIFFPGVSLEDLLDFVPTSNNQLK